MSTFAFDSIVDDVLQKSRDAYAKASRHTPTQDIVDAVDVADGADERVRKNEVLMTTLYDVIWVAVLLLRARTTGVDEYGKYLVQTSATVFADDTHKASQRWWRRHGVEHMMALAATARAMPGAAKDWWGSVKQVVVEQSYAPRRRECFDAYMFTAATPSTTIDVVLSRAHARITYHHIQDVLPEDTPEDDVLFWYELLNAAAHATPDSATNVAAASWNALFGSDIPGTPYRLIPMVQDFMRFDHRGSLALPAATTDDAKPDTVAKTICAAADRVRDAGAAAATFDPAAPGQRAIPTNRYLETQAYLRMTREDARRRSTNAQFSCLSRYMSDTYFSFRAPGDFAVRLDRTDRLDVALREILGDTVVPQYRSVGAKPVDLVGVLLVRSATPPRTVDEIMEVSYDVLRAALNPTDIDTDTDEPKETGSRALLWRFSDDAEMHLDDDTVASTWTDILAALVRQLRSTHDRGVVDLYRRRVEKGGWSWTRASDAARLWASRTGVPLDTFLPIAATRLLDRMPTLPPPAPPAAATATATVAAVADAPARLEARPATLHLDTRPPPTPDEAGEDAGHCESHDRCQHLLSWLEVDRWKKKYYAARRLTTATTTTTATATDLRATATDHRATATASYRWRRELAEFMDHFVLLTPDAKFVCRSCGFVLNQVQYFDKSDFTEGRPVSAYWPAVETLDDLGTTYSMTELVRFLDNRIDELATYLDILGFAGDRNPARASKLKETMTWSLNLADAMTKERTTEVRAQLAEASGLRKSELLPFQMTDAVLRDETKNAASVSILLAIACVLLLGNLGSDQISLVPERHGIGLPHFLKIRGKLFRDLRWHVLPSGTECADDNASFAFLLYYLSGILVTTGLWSATRIFFNFTRRKTTRAPLATWDATIHRHVLETLVEIWNLAMHPDEWTVRLTDPDKEHDRVGFYTNVRRKLWRSYCGYRVVDGMLQTFAAATVAATTRAPPVAANRPFKVLSPDPPALLLNVAPVHVDDRPAPRTLPETPPDAGAGADLQALGRHVANSAESGATYGTTFTVRRTFRGDDLPTPVVLGVDDVTFEAHATARDVLVFVNSREKTRVYYATRTLRLAGYQQRRTFVPASRDQYVDMRVGLMDLLQTFAFPVHVSHLTVAGGHTLYARLHHLVSDWRTDLHRALTNVRRMVYAVFVARDALKDPGLEAHRQRMCGRMALDDIAIPDGPRISDDRAWVRACTPGAPLRPQLVDSPQGRQARALVATTLRRAWDATAPTTTNAHVLDAMYHILNTASRPDDAGAYATLITDTPTPRAGTGTGMLPPDDLDPTVLDGTGDTTIDPDQAYEAQLDRIVQQEKNEYMDLNVDT